jgi:hypothetical protein
MKPHCQFNMDFEIQSNTLLINGLTTILLLLHCLGFFGHHRHHDDDLLVIPVSWIFFCVDSRRRTPLHDTCFSPPTLPKPTEKPKDGKGRSAGYLGDSIFSSLRVDAGMCLFSDLSSIILNAKSVCRRRHLMTPIVVWCLFHQPLVAAQTVVRSSSLITLFPSH